MTRRDFVLQSLAATTSWDSGQVHHILPTSSDRRIQVRTSFSKPLTRAPQLLIEKTLIAGRQTDGGGRFWSFDAHSLSPSRPYKLQILDAARKPLCGPWTLRTLPDPSDRPNRFRLLIYTCAGGHEALKHPDGELRFLSLDRRRRLLRRALSFGPDAVVANGDHIYWDLLTRGGRTQGVSPQGVAYAGTFDRRLNVLGTPNENVYLRATGPQIADLYGTMFREVPCFFVSDDHDYFDNDEAGDDHVSLPPDWFSQSLAATTRQMYYPEFLPDINRADGLPGSGAACGTLRFGQLAEILLFDCRRFVTLNGPTGTFIPPLTEDWIKSRMAAPGVHHVVSVPSTPPGWSAGKWGEWYPDFLDERGRLAITRTKPYWQSGWAAQHDRLLKAASDMRGRVPLFVSGDLHAIGETHISRTGSIDLSANPVVSILSGPISTGRDGWPSFARKTPPLTPSRLEVDERLKATEEHGFLFLDFTAEKITARFFKWNVKLPDEAIDSIEPFRTTELSPRG